MRKNTLRMIKLTAIVIAALVMCFLIYAAYVYSSLDRIEDNVQLNIVNQADMQASVNDKMTLISYNVGFGAYSADFGFFMDGGESSRAKSKEAAEANIAGALDAIEKANPDFVLIQELDIDADRSRHVNELNMVNDRLINYASIFAVNYDSPYIAYPILDPIGKAKSGIEMLSKYKISSSLRRRLPISNGLAKVMDLDRCYTKTAVEVENGRTLTVYNIHLSAYTDKASIVTEQLTMLINDMVIERDSGNYVLCGGDFNMDLLIDSASLFNEYEMNLNWGKPFDLSSIPERFTLIAPYDKENPVPSVRNADGKYVKGESYVLTVDGFIVSDNIEVEKSDVIDTGFAFSDHNPVYIDFILTENE